MSIQIIKYITTFLLAVAIPFLVWLVWQNRASEKLVISVLTVALLATSATITSGLFSLKEDSIEAWFVKIFVFDKITKEQPIDLSNKPYLNTFFGRHDNIISTIVLLSQAKKRDPMLTQLVDSKGENIEIEEVGKKLYQDILYYQVVRTLFNNCHFRSRLKRYTGPSGGSLSYGKPEDTSALKAIKWEKIKEIAPNNNLIEIDFSSVRPKDFYVPKTIKISGNDKELSLNNSFVTITISIRPAGGSLGPNGLAPLLGITDFEYWKYWNEDYEIKIRAKFSTWKTGHPQMQDYHDWVNHIISELRYHYDSNQLYEETKEAVLFQHSLPESPKETTEDQMTAGEKYEKWLNELREKERKELGLSIDK